MKESINRKRYPSDLTDAQWDLLAPFIPPPSPNATQEVIPRREIVNGIVYVLRTGCSWRQMPHDLPNGKTVLHYFRCWQRDGTWEKAMHALRRQVRGSMGREEERKPPVSSTANPARPVQSQASDVAMMAGKKILGRKRHILVDTQGFLLAVKVLAANIADVTGARLLLEGLTQCFTRLSHLFADHGYDGEPFEHWLKEHLGWEIEIVPHQEREAQTDWMLVNGQPVQIRNPKGGFQVQRKRWIVERTFGWLIRFRRLARDDEGLPSSSEAFIQVASIRLLLTRLAPSRY
ncbi:IS5 family transposase [Ktedonobacter sp. SOSP1-85]|uniref:IS5 family transposase n=1 Tax=Ktedonobacter sp. SOSP1-85 TaxID=2778367 RepID=UPI001A3240D7|nr:IS5 family transposase [Ktedonobacter sp. SOSP1-85]GHO72325.1 IS5 family transposase [Ktedonobacter sp. SOSP1-85]